MTDRSAAFGVNNITAMVADPTSGYVYFATSTGYIYKWNAETGSTALSAHVGTDLTSLALSADHTYLVAGEANGTSDQPLRFEKVATSNLSSTAIQLPLPTTYPDTALESYRYGVYSVAVTPDNKVIYSPSYAVSGYTPVGVFSLSNPAAISYSGASDYLSSGMMFSSEGDRYVVVADQYYSPSDISIYDTSTGITTQTIFDSLRGAAYGTVSISEAAGLIAYDDGALKVIDLTGQPVHTISDYYSGGFIASATAFLPGGHQLLAWDTSNNELRAYDTQTWAQVGSFAMPAYTPNGTAPAIEVGDDGQFLYLLGNRQSIDLAAKLSLTVVGDGSNNTLYGAAGADSLSGGGGNDTFYGGGGNDSLDGGPGNDTAVFAAPYASYTITPSGGGYEVSGPDGDSTVTNIEILQFSDSQVVLGSTSETLTARSSGDALYGGSGDDSLVAGAGNDVLDGGAGANTASYINAPSGVTVNLSTPGPQATGGSGSDTLANIQTLIGSNYNDMLTAGAAGSSLQGGLGNDILVSGPGNDTLDGGSGSDTASYIQATSGVTISLTVSGAQSTTGGLGTDTLISIENLIGSNYNDTLTAGASGSSLQGGQGDDLLIAGPGHDTLDGGPGNDTVSYINATSGVAVSLLVTGAQSTGGSGSDTLTNVENLVGSNYNDVLTAGASGSQLQGGLGDDLLIAGAGNDTLDGGPGADTVSYANATSAVTVSLAVSGVQATGGSGSDSLVNVETLIGSNYNDTLTAGAGGSVLQGGGGNDTLVSGPGNDTVDGGSGVDTAVYSGAYASYTVTPSGGGYTVSGPNGTDTLTNIEILKFSDRQLVLGHNAETLTLQASDFNAHGVSDFLIENTGGAVFVGEAQNGQAAYAQVAGLGPEWSFHGRGDFLGDGDSDFLIQNTSGAVAVGDVHNGQTSYTVVAGLGSEWSFKGTGDFLGDGKSDFLIENTSGSVVVGEVVSGHAQYTAVAGLGPEWSFKGTGDFLGNGKSDFLIENAAGVVAVGEVVSGHAQYTAIASLGPEWSFKETGDFLGDGKDDFLIENTGGSVVVGEAVSGQAQYTAITSLGPEWKFVGAGDYLGEGHDQFLIENASGAIDIGDWTGGQVHFTNIAGLGPEWVFH